MSVIIQIIADIPTLLQSVLMESSIDLWTVGVSGCSYMLCIVFLGYGWLSMRALRMASL